MQMFEGKTMEMIIGSIFLVAIIAGSIGISIFIKKKKDENVLRIQTKMKELLSGYENKGVSSLDKNSLEDEWLTKNEYSYGRYFGTINFKKYLKSGTKFSEAGFGDVVISDRAITINCDSLSSGKRRFLFKNMDGNFEVVRNSNKTELIIGYQKHELIFHMSDETIKYFALAIHLIRNPMKDSNSITF